MPLSIGVSYYMYNEGCTACLYNSYEPYSALKVEIGATCLLVLVSIATRASCLQETYKHNVGAYYMYNEGCTACPYNSYEPYSPLLKVELGATGRSFGRELGCFWYHQNHNHHCNHHIHPDCIDSGANDFFSSVGQQLLCHCICLLEFPCSAVVVEMSSEHHGREKGKLPI